MGEGGLDPSDSGYAEVAVFCEHGNEPMYFIKCAEFVR